MKKNRLFIVLFEKLCIFITKIAKKRLTMMNYGLNSNLSTFNPSRFEGNSSYGINKFNDTFDHYEENTKGARGKHSKGTIHLD